MELPPEKALFLFVGDSLPVTGAMMSELYERYKSPDGALRIIYTSESAFG
jgi:GABA(A) receptor-associated protein